MKVKVFKILCSAHLSSSLLSYVLISAQDVCRGHLLEGGGNVLITAVDKLATGDVIRDLLRLPELPGQGPLACRHYLEREGIFVSSLVWVMLG